MRVGIASGYWSQNIGNAFFNLGAWALVKKALPGAEVVRVPDAPAYWTMHRKSQGNPETSLNFLAHADLDCLLICGPQLTRNIGKIWTDTILGLRSVNPALRVGLLGTGMMNYAAKEVKRVRAQIEQIGFDFAVSRDTATFQMIRTSVKSVHDGIDSAFFLSDSYKPTKLSGDFVILNFDRYPEPRLMAVSRSRKRFEREGSSPLRIGGEWFVLEDRRFGVYLSAMGHVASYVVLALDRYVGPAQINGIKLVRTEHRTNPPMWFKVYRQPHSFAADEPWSYLDLYSSAKAVISDRVHACVAGISYGTPVRFEGRTGRSQLLSMVTDGVDSNGYLCVDLDRLDELKSAQVAFLRAVLS